MLEIDNIIDIFLTDFTSRERREFVYLWHDTIAYLNRGSWRPFFYAGSFVEGVVNFGDVDQMAVTRLFVVVDSLDDIPENIDEKQGILFVEYIDCHPGFVRLFVHKDSLVDDSTSLALLNECYSLFNGRKYFNGKKFIENFVKYSKDIKECSNWEYIFHGPAVQIGRNDTTMCFHYHHGETLDLGKCLFLVSKSHDDSKNPDIEFRWSTSALEYNKIRKFTDKEFQLYFICKELYNTYLKSNDENKKCISSYTIKTLIFNFTKRNKEELKSRSIMNLVKGFLWFFKASLHTKYLQNYFIPLNLFDVLKDDDAHRVILKIKNIEKDLVLAILKCSYFIKFYNLENLWSIYEVVTAIGDFKAKEDILTNILIEKNFQVFKFENGLYTSIRGYFDAATYSECYIRFQDISITSYFDLLCFYFNFSSYFNKIYSASAIEKFKYFLTRFLPLYLVCIAPTDNHTSIIHLFIQTLLYRLIFTPNPLPWKSTNEIPLVFYYYLCNEKEKARKLMFNICNDAIIDFKHIPLTLFNDCRYPNIVNNEIILAKYFDIKRINQPNDCSKLTISSNFLLGYMTIQLGSRRKSDIGELERIAASGDEMDIVNILKNNL